jgi:asparagine synthase (glutamine-hydrolysing)
MSIQFGRWNFDGGPVDPGDIEHASALVAPYGPDGASCYAGDGIGIIYHAFHVTGESRSETQPHRLPSGEILVWDGALDNREELTAALSGSLNPAAADAAIVALAYQRWGTACFRKLLGDWTAAIWNPTARSLVLAKDFLGARQLYYRLDERQVSWSNLLDPLILCDRKTVSLDEEYIAGWFSFFPAAHRSPFAGIASVPPSSFVRISSGHATTRQYWDFDPGKRVRYQTDAQYEEHFRHVFQESVRRRLRSDRPVLAHLSGGMDSSAIVSVADALLGRGRSEAPRLDTVSYYNDSEPDWDERPFFEKVEENRGRRGCHIQVGRQEDTSIEVPSNHFPSTPASSGTLSASAREFLACVNRNGNRVLLSGVGGDEVLGGVTTPIPEFADLLAEFRIRRLRGQMAAWAMAQKRPLLHLAADTVRAFLPPDWAGIPPYLRSVDWIAPEFLRRHRSAFLGYPSRLKLFDARLPSFQDNLSTLDALRRQVASCALPSEPAYVIRYPFLDRDLLECLYAMPREQFVRPGQRRSLMRRALKGIVPEEILGRKRKAIVVRGPRFRIVDEWRDLSSATPLMVCASLAIIDQAAFTRAVEKSRSGQATHVVALLRTLALERWLRRIKDSGWISFPHRNARNTSFLAGNSKLAWMGR